LRLGWRCFGRSRFIIVETRLQWFLLLASILGRGLASLFAALQALVHPFAHIALVAHECRVRQSVARSRQDTAAASVAGSGLSARAIYNSWRVISLNSRRAMSEMMIEEKG
jgi:hypothetical protein